MTRRPRRNHTPVFKSKVALAAVRGEQALTERRPIRFTSMCCRQSRLQHNKGRYPLIKPDKIVQTNRATSNSYLKSLTHARQNKLNHRNLIILII